MSVPRVNYDHIAVTYDQRYSLRTFEGIAGAVRPLLSGKQKALEVGCGTGHWLAEFSSACPVVGLDLSPRMLEKASQKGGGQLVCGQAAELPFADGSFDLVYCVNAIHHFDRAAAFVAEAWRVLRPGGSLAEIGMDPNAFHNDRWYIYDYFPGTLETDRLRYPSSPVIAEWMEAAGFADVKQAVAERILHTFTGREVLADPILQKHGTSQLVLVSDEAYAAGRRRIDVAIQQAEAAGETVVFPVDVSLALVTGRKP